jgi:hypothetical protein
MAQQQTKKADEKNNPPQNRTSDMRNTADSQNRKPADEMEKAKESVKKAGSEITGQAKEAAGHAKEAATGFLDEKKTDVTRGLNDIAETIRKVGDELDSSSGREQTGVKKATVQYGNNLAGKIKDFSSYLERADLRDISRDVESFARRQPALFIGGAFTLGLLAARFLKSSGSNGGGGGSSRRMTEGGGDQTANLNTGGGRTGAR